MKALEIRGESVEKCKGCANKISYISAARCSLLPIWYHINAKAYQVFFNSRLVVKDNYQLRS